MVGFAMLFTILAFVNAGGGNIDLRRSAVGEPLVTAAMLSLPQGPVFTPSPAWATSSAVLGAAWR